MNHPAPQLRRRTDLRVRAAEAPLGTQLAFIADLIGACRRPREVLCVAVSGIDGSGKTHVSAQLEAALAVRGLRVARIGLDPWQNPQSVRFGGPDEARHFYDNVFRWDALFEELVEPLVRTRSVDLDARVIRTDADVWYAHRYVFEDIDIVLLEGIFLLRRDLAERFGVRIWVECSFETALGRALARNQEGLSPERIRSDYARIYFPAQRLHFALDRPQERADLIIDNDPRQGHNEVSVA